MYDLLVFEPRSGYRCLESSTGILAKNFDIFQCSSVLIVEDESFRNFLYIGRRTVLIGIGCGEFSWGYIVEPLVDRSHDHDSLTSQIIMRELRNHISWSS